MKPLSVLTVLVVALLLVCGCTGTTSDEKGAAAAPTAAPTETLPPSTQATTIQTTAPTPTEAAPAPTAEPSRTVLADEGTAVYAGYWKQISFTNDLGVDYLYPEERYEIRIESSQPINVLIVRDNVVSLFKTNPPEWSTNDNKWKYYPGVEPVLQFDEVTRKTFVLTAPELGRYSLLLDGRMSPQGVFVINDAASVDYVITKLS